VRPSLVKTGRQKGGQLLPQRVDEELGHVLGAGIQREDGNALAQRINGHPEPQHLCGTAQSGSELIQLDMREHQLAEGALVQALRVRSCPHEPGRDSGMPDAKDALGRRHIQPFGQSTQHQGYLTRGCFQAVQWRVDASTEGRATGLAAKGLDALGLPMAPITHQSMDLCIGDPVVLARSVRTGKALGQHADGALHADF
jgi:hypothetical protein